jgi:hypothetical protein
VNSTISEDRKTLTMIFDAPLPQNGDDAINVWVEQQTGDVQVRYISPEVIKVMRAYLAVAQQAQALPNLEALILSAVTSMIQSQIYTFQPDSLKAAIANEQAAQQAVQDAIKAVLAQLVLVN